MKGDYPPDPEWMAKAAVAFRRMRKASMAGKGVRISAEELKQMALTTVGDILAQYDD